MREKDLPLFQSLTGSIHTGKRGGAILFIVRKVSIPHRFNSHIQRVKAKQAKISIPHRFNWSGGSKSFNPSQVQFTQDKSKTLTKPNSHTKI
jgi:hypothetical protein